MNANNLNALSKHLGATLSWASRNAKEEIIEEVLECYRKIRLAKILISETFIAIAGVQGVGKTALIRHIYGLNGWLLSNPGRGETTPVFIREKEGIAEPQAVKIVVSSENVWEEVEKDCLQKEFEEIVYGRNVYNKSESVLFVKLFVPPKFNMPQGWVLLPGYEVRTDDNYKWQEVMRYVMKNSTGLVVVTAEDRLASNQQSEIFNDMKEMLSSKKPVIAISHTEHLRSETINEEEKHKNDIKLKELRKTAKERFEISNLESIVCVGTDSKNWMSEFEEAIVKNLTQEDGISKQKDSVLNILKTDIPQIIQKLEMELGDLGSKEFAKENTVDRVLNEFDKARMKYRKELSKKLNDEFSKMAQDAIDKAKSEYESEETGLVNKVKIVYKRATFAGLEVDQNRKNRVEKHWTSDKIFQVDKKALAEVSQSILKHKLSTDKISENNLLGVDDTADVPSDLMFQENNGTEIIEGMNILFRGKSVVASREKSIEQAIRVLPAIAMEYVRVAQNTLIAQNHNDELLPKDEIDIIKEIKNKLPSNVEGLTQYAKPLINTLMGFLSLDAVDGKIDGEVGGNNGNAGGGLLSAIIPASLISVAGFIGVAYTMYQISSSIMINDQKQMAYISEYSRAIADHFISSRLSAFDENMEKLSDVIRERLENQYGVTQNLGESHGLMVTLRHLKDVQKTLKAQLVNDKTKTLA